MSRQELQDPVIQKAAYGLRVSGGCLTVSRRGKTFLTLPACVSVNGIESVFDASRQTDDEIEFFSVAEALSFSLYDDCITVGYSRSFDAETPVFEVELFSGNGVKLEGFDRAFCPQPRRNAGNNMSYYSRLPDISADGYFSPPALTFAIGSGDGWVSFGLLDLPDTKICRLTDRLSFLVESCGGNKRVRRYTMPRVIIAFPDDEMDSVTLFRNKLIEFGSLAPDESRPAALPVWWKNPLFCTYGDQLVEDRVGQSVDEAWVLDCVREAEDTWGVGPFNLILDDSWQKPHSFLPVADKDRFPDFRGLIDTLHERGHHVLLWVTPLFDKITNGFVTRSQELGVLSGAEFPPTLWGSYFAKFPGCRPIDYTSDHARTFVREVCERLFGQKDGQYNADGVKIDFLGLLRDPAVSSYAHPEKGTGIRELYLFFRMFREEAKRVRPDVLIDSTSGDPRFGRLIDLNRLHDIHCGNMEKEIRAELLARACPNTMIDSDGCLMYNSWLKAHYISASVYGIPSNYYVKRYHDAAGSGMRASGGRSSGSRADLTADEKRALGSLFGMSRHRPDGVPMRDGSGNWRLVSGNNVNAYSQRGETVIYYPEEGGTGYLFTFCDETVIIPLFGRKISEIEPTPKHLIADYARDRAILRITPGVVHTFKNADAGDGIERGFLAL